MLLSQIVYSSQPAVGVCRVQGEVMVAGDEYLVRMGLIVSER